MISHVFLSSHFTRHLKRLHQGGGSAKAAAEHAEAIIRQWVSGEVKNPRQLKRNTRYGEARLKNCFKYDLVGAYRLLAVMDGEFLIFLFVGSHDECDQWLCHNKGWEPGLEKKRAKVLPVQDGTIRAAAEETESDAARVSEDDLFGEIDERDLRIIFSGICRTKADPKEVAFGIHSEK